MKKPEESEYPEYYKNKYICLVPGGDILETMRLQMRSTTGLLEGLGEAWGGYRYAPGKWSIKELVGHLNDEERLFGYQAFRISRNDCSQLPGIDENLYVELGQFENRSLESISEEFKYLRSANIEMFSGMSDEMLQRCGTADDHDLSVRAIPWVMTGHVIHHITVLKERYL